MKKRFFSAVVAIMLIVSLLPVSSLQGFAAEPEEGSEEAGAEAEETEITDEEYGIQTISVFPSEEETEEEDDERHLSDIKSIPEDITVGEAAIGGMTGEEAEEALSDFFSEKEEAEVSLLIDGDEKAVLTMGELGLTWENEEEVVRTVADVSTGNLLVQYRVRKELENDPEMLDFSYSLDEEKATDILTETLSDFNVEAQNATCSRNSNGTWTITPDVTGISLDAETAANSVLRELDKWDGESISVDVPAEVTQASVTSDVYEGMSTTPIASCSTDYMTATASRNHNVELGASRLNGTMLLPGQELSMLDALAPITSAGGYQYANAFSGGNVIQSIGGGICQIATTFYGAVLDLELEVLERYNHSMEVSYVDFTLDATISPGGKNLRVRNSTGHALYIEAYTSGNYLTVNFYGVDNRPSNRSINYRVERIEVGEKTVTSDTEDLSLKPGKVVYDQDAHRHAVADLYKDVYVDGVLTESVYMYRDTYVASGAIRRYGPAIDAEGTHYYINDQGYCVGEDGSLYRLNEDGTWLDDPLAGKKSSSSETEEAEEEENEEETETEKEKEKSEKSEKSDKDSEKSENKSEEKTNEKEAEEKVEEVEEEPAAEEGSDGD